MMSAITEVDAEKLLDESDEEPSTVIPMDAATSEQVTVSQPAEEKSASSEMEATLASTSTSSVSASSST